MGGREWQTGGQCQTGGSVAILPHAGTQKITPPRTDPHHSGGRDDTVDSVRVHKAPLYFTMVSLIRTLRHARAVGLRQWWRQLK